jgi:hypothetical protein
MARAKTEVGCAPHVSRSSVHTRFKHTGKDVYIFSPLNKRDKEDGFQGKLAA